MRAKRDFTSRPLRTEMIAALGYFAVHIWIMPSVLHALLAAGVIADAATANLLGYLFGTVVLLIFMWRFLRREFDSFCDMKGYCFGQIGISYGLYTASNLVIGYLFLFLGAVENPNNSAIIEMSRTNIGKVAAFGVFLAPILEELIFRAGLFNFLRKYNRVLAYAVSMLLFSAYHVWGYAAADPTLWVYAIQYLPLTFILCRCYERTNSIWSTIFLHMLINGVAMLAVRMISQTEAFLL